MLQERRAADRNGREPVPRQTTRRVVPKECVHACPPGAELIVVFGPKEDEALDYNAAKKLFVELTKKINGEVEVPLSPEEVAAGFLRVANETMAR